MEKANFNFDGFDQSKKTNDNDPFILRNGSQRMAYAQNLKIPKKLLGDLIWENTVTIIVARTGVGKSVLAYQLADAISRGTSMIGLENESKPQNFLFIDFENGEKVWEKRYSQQKIIDGEEVWYNHYEWNERSNFLDPKDAGEFTVPSKNATQWWFEFIKKKAEQCDAKIIFIDNLFALIQEGGIESTKEAKPLIRELNKMKKSEGWTIIVIHHTPKKPPYSELSENDVAGSSTLTSLIDSVIGIGDSYYNDSDRSRYIKQLKAPRFTEKKYGKSNVITCKLEYIEPNFLGFERIELDEFEQEFKKETEHLSNPNISQGKSFIKSETEERREAVKEKLKEDPEFNREHFGKEWNVSRITIQEDIKRIKRKWRII